MDVTPGVPRGCGTRVQGGCYLAVPTSRYGTPLERFLVDPPLVLADIADELGLSALGVTIINNTVYDIVGQEHYPNVADFVEEARRYGVSRRISKTLLGQLQPGAALYLAHTRAHISNYAELEDVLGSSLSACPTGKPEHGLPPVASMCARLWWHDVAGAVAPADSGDYLLSRFVRHMPGGWCYETELSLPYEEYTVRYDLAIFMALPIAQIEVVRAEDGSHEQAAERAALSGLPVAVVDA